MLSLPRGCPEFVEDDNGDIIIEFRLVHGLGWVWVGLGLGWVLCKQNPTQPNARLTPTQPNPSRGTSIPKHQSN